MKKRTSFVARILAALALAAAVLAVVLIVSAATKNDSSSKGRKADTTKQEKPTHPRTKAATYTVKPGDTLIAIAHKTGIRVSEIQALNPEVDPQILENGEVLKLK